MKHLLQNYREVLRVHSVRVVLLALSVSVAGDAATMVALLLRAHASGSGPWAVTGLLIAVALPVVLATGPAGALADRADPRRVLATAGLVQAAAVAGLAAVDGLPATVALVLLLQTAFALGNPSWSAVVPRLVPDGTAGRVVSLQQALRGIAGPLGAGAGGVLVQWRGPGAALLLDAVTFLVLAATALTLPRLPRVAAAAAPATPTPAVTSAARAWLGALASSLLPRDGVATLRADRVLGVLVLALLPLVVTLESVNVVEVFLVRDVLRAGAAQFGAVAAVEGGAAVVGALLAGAATTRRSRTAAVLTALAGVGVVQVAEGLAPTYPVYLALAAVVGLLLGVVNALVFALLLDEVAAARRGSVLALVGGLSRAAGAAALLLGGVVGALAGPRATYVVAGVGTLVVAVVAALVVHRSVDGGSTGRASRAAPAPSTLEA